MAEDLSAYVSRLALALPDPGEGGVAHELDGSLLFVDLSGFTAMSERLAARGRVGAEEVTDVISSTFAELVAVAWSSGGGLLKFGGDALLLAFTDSGHAVRAAHAAIGMRRSLRAIGAIHTSAGLVRLRMTLGVHSGDLHLVLVGSSSRELFVVGPGASAVVRAEGMASTGGIVLSPGAASQLPMRCRGAPVGDGFVLARSPGTQPADAPPAPRSEVDPRRHVPRAVRDHLEDGGGAGEHRQAAVAFLHVDGTDDVLARHGAGELADRLHVLVAGAQVAAEEAGVAFLANDVDADGAKLILTAGVPAVRGDDEDRLVHVARQIVATDCGLGLRAGVHAGPVFAGLVGPPFRRTYTVMGDAVNTAARIMARADAGEVLVSQPVLDACVTRYRTRATEPFAAKGKKRPMVAHAVIDASDAAATVAADVPMIGRHEELDLLARTVDSATQRDGIGPTVVAPRGMGSTRLLQAAVESRPDLRWVFARCSPVSRLTPYATLRQVLRPLLGLLDEPSADDASTVTSEVASIDPELVRWVGLLGPLLGSAIDATRDVEELEPRARVAQVQAIVLAVMAAQPATAVVLDHVDEADAASARLLTNVAGGIEATAVAVISVAESAPAWAGVQIDLPQMGEEALVELCLQMARGRLLAHQPARIAKRAEGNPRLALELLRAVEAGGDLDALPASIERLVAARIDALPVRSRQLVRSLSVLGPSFALEDALALAGVDESGLAPVMDIVERRGALVRFRSSMVRDVAYEGLPFRLRGALHAQAATLLEADVERAQLHPEVLAVHHQHAGNLVAAWRWSTTAAARAAEAGAWVECASSLRRGLQVAGRLSVPVAELATARRQLAQALWAVGDASAAEAVVSRAVAEAPEPLDRARALLLGTLIADDLGRQVAALRRAQRGLATTTAVDAEDAATEREVKRTRLRLLIALSSKRSDAGRHRDGLALADEALALAREVGDIAGQAHADHYAAGALRAIGDPHADDRELRALEGFQAIGDLRTQAAALNGLALGWSSTGRFDAAIDAYRRASELLQRIGAAHVAAIIENNVGNLLLKVGRYDDAAERLEQAARRLASQPVMQSLAAANLALVRVAQRRLDDASAALTAAGHLVGTQYESTFWIAEAELGVAEADLGRTEAALVALARLPTDVEDVPVLTRLRAHVAILRGDRDAGVALLERSLAEAREAQEAAAEASTLAVLSAVTGDPAWQEAFDDVTRRVGIVAVPAVPEVVPA